MTPHLGGSSADGAAMDAHVQWFRREVGLAVAQRLAIEAVVVAVVIGVLLSDFFDHETALLGTLSALPLFMVLCGR